MKTSKPSISPRALSRSAWLVLSAAAAMFAGCATEPESHVVAAPPPSAPPVMNATIPVQTVTTVQGTTTATTIPGSNSVIITQAPPMTRPTEVMVSQPSPQHVWIEGYWAWQAERYVWVGGHWEVPPRSGAVWVPPMTQRRDNDYVFQEGYWK